MKLTLLLNLFSISPEILIKFKYIYILIIALIKSQLIT